MQSQEPRSLSGLAFVVIAVASGCLTWLCVRWFGAQDPLTAAIAVILVELFIACFAMIVVLIAERMSAAYLGYEKTYLEKPVAPRRLWLWRPLWEPRVRYASSSLSTANTLAPGGWRRDLTHDMPSTDTIAFPDNSAAPFEDAASQEPRRRAA